VMAVFDADTVNVVPEAIEQDTAGANPELSLALGAKVIASWNFPDAASRMMFAGHEMAGFSEQFEKVYILSYHECMGA
jgi:hypothetical protein